MVLMPVQFFKIVRTKMTNADKEQAIPKLMMTNTYGAIWRSRW